ncbi:T9SS type A sorting domain-containing protein [Bacteroidales bacterium OttesenSCG-928-C19]|nr:T9SS type A sorting domain-containing protein [Bacteroidales bacterium OttesenSCG-928-C19]
MKKQLLLLACALILSVQMWTGNQIQAQSCPGLKNPVTLSGGNYSGRIAGIKGDGITPDAFTNGVIQSWRDVFGIGLEYEVSNTGNVYGGDEIIKQRGLSGAQFDRRFEIVGEGMYFHGMDSNTCGRLSMTPPDTSFKRSIRIGNSMNSEVEELYYEMLVDENNCLLLLWYALVVEDPGHGEKYNPRIEIEVQEFIGIDPNTKEEIWQNKNSCSRYNMTISDNVANEWGTHNDGCLVSGGSYGDDLYVYYKPWSTLVINLKEYLNSKVRIRIYNQDCLPTGHYSYMYLAGECRPMEITVNGCATIGNDTVGSLEAPACLSDYQWYLGTYPNGLPVSEDKGGKDSILYVMDYDFFNAERFENKLDCYCTFKSYLDSNNPCEDYLSAEIRYTRPRTHISLHPSSGRWATFTNQSYVPSSESMIDTAKTVWYIEDSIYYAHSQVKHQFSLEGSLKVVTLIVENTEGCITKKDFDGYEKLDVRLISNNSDYGSVVGEGVYDYYEVVTIQAIPNQGCEFLNWTKNGEVVSTENPLIFSVIEDVELVANFSQKFEVVTDSTSVSITWVAVEDAHGYTVTIYSDEGRTQIVAVLEFDGDGNLLSIEQGKSTKSNALSCTVNDLMEGITYYFSIIAYDNNKEVINEESGFFITKSETVGIAQVPESLISIYPNPTTGKLTIKNGESGINKIEIFTIFGKKLSTFNYKLLNEVETSTVEIDLSDFAKGVYILQINDKTAKVIKE